MQPDSRLVLLSSLASKQPVGKKWAFIFIYLSGSIKKKVLGELQPLHCRRPIPPNFRILPSHLWTEGSWSTAVQKDPAFLKHAHLKNLFWTSSSSCVATAKQRKPSFMHTNKQQHGTQVRETFRSQPIKTTQKSVNMRFFYYILEMQWWSQQGNLWAGKGIGEVLIHLCTVPGLYCLPIPLCLLKKKFQTVPWRGMTYKMNILTLL